MLTVLLLQATPVQLFLQSVATFVGVVSFCFTIYVSIRGFYKSDRDKKAAQEEKREQQIQTIADMLNRTVDKVDRMEHANSEIAKIRSEKIQEIGEQDKRVSVVERSTELMQKIFTEYAMRQESTMAQFLEYIKQNHQLQVQVERLVVHRDNEVETNKQYRSHVEKQLEDINKKVSTIAQDQRRLPQ